jgi:hypothetical protein
MAATASSFFTNTTSAVPARKRRTFFRAPTAPNNSYLEEMTVISDVNRVYTQVKEQKMCTKIKCFFRLNEMPIIVTIYFVLDEQGIK